MPNNHSTNINSLLYSLSKLSKQSVLLKKWMPMEKVYEIGLNPLLE